MAYDMPLVDPKAVGIEYSRKPPTGGPQPGWHAVSVNQIHRREGDYLYFLEFRPDRHGRLFNLHLPHYA